MLIILLFQLHKFKSKNLNWNKNLPAISKGTSATAAMSAVATTMQIWRLIPSFFTRTFPKGKTFASSSLLQRRSKVQIHYSPPFIRQKKCTLYKRYDCLVLFTINTLDCWGKVHKSVTHLLAKFIRLFQISWQSSLDYSTDVGRVSCIFGKQPLLVKAYLAISTLFSFFLLFFWSLFKFTWRFPAFFHVGFFATLQIGDLVWIIREGLGRGGGGL